MICSFLLPTRGRPEQLREAVESLIGSASSIEVLIRVDEDDEPSRAVASALVEEHENVRTWTGPRPANGYEGIHHLYTGLAKQSSAPWVWIWNDDTILQDGKGWDKQLEKIKPENIIVHPEMHRLNNSCYLVDRGSAFPIVPNRCWEKVGHEQIGENADAFFINLAQQHNWQVEFLKGVTVWHQRADDAVLAEHRKL